MMKIIFWGDNNEKSENYKRGGGDSLSKLVELQSIFVKVFNEKNILLTNETNQIDIEGWDSLTHINLMLTIVKHFHIEANFEELQRLDQVGKIMNFIDEKLKKSINNIKNKDEILIHELIEIIGKENRLQEKYLKKQIAELTESEIVDLINLINFYLEQGYSTEYQAKSYLRMITDIMEEQKYFMEYGSYRYDTFEAVAQHVYFDKSYMTQYMIGVGLSTYFWSNHLAIMRWYLEKIKNVSGNRYLEIGPGHGEYFVRAIKNGKINKYVAVDISETSVQLTKKFVEYSFKGKKDNYQVICKDFFRFDDEKFDVVVMGEVLEHVEKPILFLKKIHEISNEDAFIYITTTINGPVIDHIYLFKTIEDVFEVVKQAGFTVIDYICPTANNITLEKAINKKAPISIALTLKKDL